MTTIKKMNPGHGWLNGFCSVTQYEFADFLRTYPHSIRCERFSNGWGYFDETSGAAIAYWRSAKHDYWITT